MTLKKNDCTWYYVGGTLAGEWRRADAGCEEACRRMGYVAHPGRLAIGPPEGAPSAKEFAAVLGR